MSWLKNLMYRVLFWSENGRWKNNETIIGLLQAYLGAIVLHIAMAMGFR